MTPEQSQKAGRALFAIAAVGFVAVVVIEVAQGDVSWDGLGRSTLNGLPLVLVGAALWIGGRRKAVSYALLATALALAGVNLVSAFL